MSKYQRLAQQISQQIEQQVWQPGQRLPSLRRMAADSGLSLMTVMSAYQLLEQQGRIEAVPRSGYRVKDLPTSRPALSSAATHVRDQVSINNFAYQVLQASNQPGLLPLGSAFPDPNLFPLRALARGLGRASAALAEHPIDHLPPGSLALRQAIARQYSRNDMTISPDDILITAGAMEGLNLALEAVTQPGDWVVIEAPAFYGALQAIERLGLRAIAVATDPKQGMQSEALADVLKRYPVKACWLMSRYQNPLGFCLSQQRQQALYDLFCAHDVWVIEDDVYGELAPPGANALQPMKAIDQQQRILHCGSFSKSLAPGFRLGWVSAGEQLQRLAQRQFIATLSSSAPEQQAVAAYLDSRPYQTHLRQLRSTLHQRKQGLLHWLHQCMPANVHINDSQGGYFIWLSLPDGHDAIELYHQALQLGISLAPGALFSADPMLQRGVRLNASYPLSDRLHDGVQQLAQLVS